MKAKAKTSRFVVSFTVEVEHEGHPADVLCDVANAVTDVIDTAMDYGKRAIKGHGVKITDAVNFGAEVE